MIDDNYNVPFERNLNLSKYQKIVLLSMIVQDGANFLMIYNIIA